MRYSLTISAFVLAGVMSAKTVLAQHCHPPPPSEQQQVGLSVGLRSEFSTYRTTRYEGEYQGLVLRAGWDHQWVRIHAALPGYRLTRNGPETYGVGDALVDVRVPFARTEDDTLVGGVVLAGTLPSGDAARDLGMGHVMLMPGFWVTLRRERVFLSTQVLYGRALASGATTHLGDGTGPIVNPMNMSEIELALNGGVNLVEYLRLRGGIYGAVPIAVTAGAERAAVVFGVDLMPVGWLDIGAELHLPVAGTPFLTKTAIVLAARF